MKRIIIGTALSVSLMLIGCGSDSPENIVKDYVKVWDDGSVEKVVKYVDKETKDEIEETVKDCMRSDGEHVLKQELKKYQDEVDNMWRKHNPFMVFKNTKKTSTNFQNEMKKIVEDTSLNNNDKTLKIGMLILDQTDIYRKVKSEMSPVAYKMIAFTFANKMRAESGDIFGAVDNYSKNEYFKSLILEDMKQNDNVSILKIEKSCIDKIFHPDTLDEVNIIETINISADRKDVKVELLYKNKSSKKKHIELEKIAGKWRVTTMLL